MPSKNFTAINVKSSKKCQIIDITGNISDFLREKKIESGICFVYVPHTTAALSVNENADPDVKTDILMGLKDIVSPELGYDHIEGNSPAHIKSSIIGNTAEIIIEDGQLALGTWQGVYFCEFDGPRTRKVYIKVLEG